MSFIPIPFSHIARFKVHFCKKTSQYGYCVKEDKCKYAHSEYEKRKILDPIPWDVQEYYTEKEIYGKAIKEFGKLKILTGPLRIDISRIV